MLGRPARREFLMRQRGRHDARVLGENAGHDGALLRIAGNDRRHADPIGFQRLVAQIQPHPGHARTLVAPVAGEASSGHDRPYVAVEAHLRAPPRRPQGGTQQYPSYVPRGFNIHPPRPSLYMSVTSSITEIRAFVTKRVMPGSTKSSSFVQIVLCADDVCFADERRLDDNDVLNVADGYAQ